jgi:hypothetical protein
VKRTGEGAIGTRMSGNSRRDGVERRNLPAIKKAKDILTVHERGISEIDPNVLDVCWIATGSPALLMVHQSRMVRAVWQKLAEANKLHGIRKRTWPPSGLQRMPRGTGHVRCLPARSWVQPYNNQKENDERERKER